MGFLIPLLFIFFQLLINKCSSISNNFNSFNNVSKFLFINDSNPNFGYIRNVNRNKTSTLYSESETSSGSSPNREEFFKKIKFLRDSTGSGIQDCFNALKESNGDVRAASQILMKTLLDKVPDNEGSDSEVVMSLQGTIAMSCSPKVCSLIDMRCDTDFVANNAVFTSLARSFANSALNSKLKYYDSHHTQDSNNTDSNDTNKTNKTKVSLDELKKDILENKCLRCGSKLSHTGAMVRGALLESIAVARIGFLESDANEYFVFYVHSDSNNTKGSSSYSGSGASVVTFGLDETDPDSFYSYSEEEIKPNETNCCLSGYPCVYSNSKYVDDFRTASEKDEFKEFLRQVAVHVFADQPKEVDIESYDKEGLEESKKEYEKLVSSGKSEEMAEKIVKGKLSKKYRETVLMEQVFTFGNGKNTISEELETNSKKFSKDIKLKKFLSYSILDNLINFKHPKKCTFYNTNIKF